MRLESMELPPSLFEKINPFGFSGGIAKSFEWPLWAKAFKQFATPDDKGIGDVVARMIGDENSAKFKVWHLAIFRRTCRCNGRQNLWNMKYPLNLKAT